MICREKNKVIKTFYFKRKLIMEVSSDEDICKAIITITFSCQQTIIKHKKAKKIYFTLFEFKSKI